MAGPATRPAALSAAEVARREQDKTRLFDFLMKEYGKILDRSRDRLARSLAVVRISHVPRADATDALLSLLKTEKDPLVAMVAWQCLLSRAPQLSEAQYRQWLDLTMPLAQRGAFRGDLRVGLLRLLSVAPPDARARELFSRCFASTNSQDPTDLPTIVAMGETLKAWGDPTLVESVLNRLTVQDDAMRAEAVLHAAGCDVFYAEERWDLGSRQMWKMGVANYADWWRRARGKFKPAVFGPAAWRSLTPQYVAVPEDAAAVDPNDLRWRRELELSPPDLKAFQVAVVVDATGSMGEVLTWLRSDVRRMMDAMALAFAAPEISVTFYRDFGDEFVAKTVPLTRRVDVLSRRLTEMDAKGGGDIPEAVREGLVDCLKSSNWAQSDKTRKALVLVGDAPPHPQAQDDCEKIAAAAAARGFRLYAVKVKTGYEAPDMSAFDKLAAAGNGVSLAADLRFGPPASQGGDPLRWWLLPGSRLPELGDGEDESKYRPDPSARPPGEQVITGLLVDAISPQFKETVQPAVAVLWQMLKEPVPEKHPQFPPPPKNRVFYTPRDPQQR